MFTRQAPDRRLIPVLIILAFLAAMTWWWSIRAGRLGVSTAPTPLPGGAGAAAAPAAAAGGTVNPQ